MEVSCSYRFILYNILFKINDKFMLVVNGLLPKTSMLFTSPVVKECWKSKF
jgi:hypothetical protein